MAERIIYSIVAVIAAGILVSCLLMSPPITGRLHPGLIPGALAAATLLVALMGVFRPRLFTVAEELVCQAPEPTPLRSIFAAVAATLCLAVATSTLGMLPSTMAAGIIAALGVAGVTLWRAILIGAGIAATAALLFVGLLRQPLKLLPGVW